MPRHLKLQPDLVKDTRTRMDGFIVEGDLLLTDYEWSTGTTPTDAQLADRRRVVTGKVMVEPMPLRTAHGELTGSFEDRSRPATSTAQLIELRAAAPIRARCDQADMADTPLFGQGSLL